MYASRPTLGCLFAKRLIARRGLAQLSPSRLPSAAAVCRAALLLCVSSAQLLCAHAQRDVTTLVHPLVGTANAGQTYPAAGVPFAMTHWTPQTRAGEIKCISPFYFADQRIQGFRGTHFVSGSCMPDYGSVTVSAGMGPLKTAARDRASTFDRASEHASPSSYTVDLRDAGMRASITGTTRAGYLRFTALHEGDAWLVVENNARAGEGFVQIDPQANEVRGEVPVRREYAGAGKPAGFSGHFSLSWRTSAHATAALKDGDYGSWIGPQTFPAKARQDGDGLPKQIMPVPSQLSNVPSGPLSAPALDTGGVRPGFGVYVQFHGLHRGDTIDVRIGTSFTSLEHARKNLAAEIPHWNFAETSVAAHRAWQKALSQIAVQGSSPAAPVFYTALYHSLLHPRTTSDVDGTYLRFAGKNQTEHAQGFVYYDDFSMWDIYRAQLPLLTLTDPQRVGDMMHSLVLKGEQGGFLPIFPAWNSYTSEMTGDHSSVALIDAYRKGIRGFDVSRAYALMRKNATTLPDTVAEYEDGKGRRGLESYLHFGYIPLEDHIPHAFHKDEQVSRTLDYAFDDAMLGLLANDLHHAGDAALFGSRGHNWTKVIDPSIGFARGRHQDGSWVEPFDPGKPYSWITEGLPWQDTFSVPQDTTGLIKLLGGDEAFVRKLDAFFAGGFYEHGNEPSHHIAYLYDAAGAPRKTQQRVRLIMEKEYADTPAGLAGNDDAGQMSAWYVMSALGLYQVTPGVPEYWLGSPRFDEVRLHLPGGKLLVIRARGSEHSDGTVKRILFNGTPVSGYTLPHSSLVQGGTLVFERE